jgi:hypothetical protein
MKILTAELTAERLDWSKCAAYVHTMPNKEKFTAARKHED